MANEHTWKPDTQYPKGKVVVWDNANYECQVDHISDERYPPGKSTAWRWTDKRAG